jgi:hypothetical protein
VAWVKEVYGKLLPLVFELYVKDRGFRESMVGEGPEGIAKNALGLAQVGWRVLKEEE